MKTLYFDCSMGASANMLASALVDLFEDKHSILNQLNSFGIEDVKYELIESEKCGIKAHCLKVCACNQEISNNGLSDIECLVNASKISDKVKKDIINVYEIIALAESKVRGIAINEIHFSQEGNKDVIADITAVCYLLDLLNPDNILASPVHVGSGNGIFAVPAPTTALILKDVPIYGGQIKGELCTAAGAALLKYFVKSFGNMPVLITKAIGYGVREKDSKTANYLRVISAECIDNNSQIVELNFVVDDMTGEQQGFALNKILEAGAADAYMTPIFMKKNRPGIQFTVACLMNVKEEVIKAIFKHTTTIGLKETIKNRYTLNRSLKTVSTPCGNVRKKEVDGFGISRYKYEYDDLTTICEKLNCSILEAEAYVKKYEQKL